MFTLFIQLFIDALPLTLLGFRVSRLTSRVFSPGFPGFSTHAINWIFTPSRLEAVMFFNFSASPPLIPHVIQLNQSMNLLRTSPSNFIQKKRRRNVHVAIKSPSLNLNLCCVRDITIHASQKHLTQIWLRNEGKHGFGNERSSLWYCTAYQLIDWWTHSE